jgi:hypothetical protein
MPDRAGSTDGGAPEKLSAPTSEWLRSPAVRDYKVLLHNLWLRLVRLNHSLLIMRTIENVPWDLLFGVDGYTFWSYTYKAHGDVAVLVIHGLLNDDAPDNLSFDRFKNKLMVEWIVPERKAQMGALLARCRRSPEVNEALARIENLRHNHVAHTLVPGINPNDQPLRASLSWAELDDVFGYLRSYLEVLGLGVEYALAWPGSGYEKGAGRCLEKSDLNEALDAFLATSGFIHWPEKRPEVWAIKRQMISSHELEQFNSIRRRLSLTTA